MNPVEIEGWNGPELIRRAFESAPDAMILVDSSGVIRHANEQFRALFGYSASEIIGRPVETLMPASRRSRHLAQRREYINAPRMRAMGEGLSLSARRRDGTEFPVEISLSPIVNGDSTCIAAAIRDISAHRRLEWELRAARQTAENAHQAAVRANEGKSRFLAAASHDLRQPLQTLSLLNASLRRLVSDPAAGRALAQQDDAIAAMSRLLNALLDISKLESGAVKPEPTDFTVAAVFEEMRKEFAELAAGKGLEFRVEETREVVYSDRALVVQILRNLVANAIKHTRQGWIQLRSLHEQAMVRIEVLDTGIGIPADKLPYIHDEFYQVGASDGGARDGYGLGLSIVKHVTRLLNLKLDVSSQIDHGSTFSLALPASHARTVRSRRSRGARGLSAPSVSGSRLFLLEDEASVRAALALLLETDGYYVTALPSESEALHKIAQGARPDLLIADYHLGNGETGLHAIDAVRGALGTPLKAILMTGDTSSAIQQLPADAKRRILSKPADAEELLLCVKEMLAQRSVSQNGSAKHDS